jgi:rSAM/selenodomain-associated transferase 1
VKNASAIVVMMKPPVAGKVKTRLVPPLTFEEAATLYYFFIKDIFSSILSLNALDLFVALDSTKDSPGQLASIIPEAFTTFDQVGETLGERLYNVFERLFSEGFSSVAIIGSDSPDIKPELIEESFRLLEVNSGKVVLGPAQDGGYYLIAMDSLDKRPFEGIEWSTASVLDETIKKLDGKVVLLPKWYDIDRPADILKLLDSGSASESLAYLESKDIPRRIKEFQREREELIDGAGKA